jgi:hypothetical protein
MPHPGSLVRQSPQGKQAHIPELRERSRPQRIGRKIASRFVDSDPCLPVRRALPMNFIAGLQRRTEPQRRIAEPDRISGIEADRMHCPAMPSVKSYHLFDDKRGRLRNLLF